MPNIWAIFIRVWQYWLCSQRVTPARFMQLSISFAYILYINKTPRVLGDIVSCEHAPPYLLIDQPPAWPVHWDVGRGHCTTHIARLLRISQHKCGANITFHSVVCCCCWNLPHNARQRRVSAVNTLWVNKFVIIVTVERSSLKKQNVLSGNAVHYAVGQRFNTIMVMRIGIWDAHVVQRVIKLLLMQNHGIEMGW